MAINNINTNYTGPGIGQTGTSGQVAPQQTSQGVVVSGGSVDLSTGQTFSGQVVSVDGKEIKLQLPTGQTINASLEGNISAKLGQILSLEVASTDGGKMSLRPLYTNLNNSSTIRNALFSANLPNTEQYGRMVDSMMSQGLPINKNALNAMAQKVNTFPNANPETLVELSKLGIEINEVTINQYENYKGLEHQIINDVMNLTDGIAELLDDSLSDARLLLDPALQNADAAAENAAESETPQPQAPVSKLLNAFLNVLNGPEGDSAKADGMSDSTGKVNQEAGALAEEAAGVLEESADDEKRIDPRNFDTARQILELVDEDSVDESPISRNLTKILNRLSDEIYPDKWKEDGEQNKNAQNVNNNSDHPDNTPDVKPSHTSSEADARTLFTTLKNVLNTLEKDPSSVSEKVKQHLTELLSDKDFSKTLKDTVSKQMLLKPEDVTSSKNIEELYSRISRQANQAMELLQQSGKDNPALMKSVTNINDNVNFMNQLNQAVTYVQIPLLMNNKSAHGDLYVYTKKRNLQQNDGHVSALLHLDMDNLGPMDVFVSLTNSTKVNTHFYLQDDATIDFIEQHMDILNEKLAKKGYDTTMQVSVKDKSKGPTRMTDEFMKNDPEDTGMAFSKFSFDVRA